MYFVFVYIGYHGKNCNEPCPSGFYGEDCAVRCNCKNSAKCDGETGQCICLPGKKNIFIAENIIVVQIFILNNWKYPVNRSYI